MGVACRVIRPRIVVRSMGTAASLVHHRQDRFRNRSSRSLTIHPNKTVTRSVILSAAVEAVGRAARRVVEEADFTKAARTVKRVEDRTTVRSTTNSAISCGIRSPFRTVK